MAAADLEKELAALTKERETKAAARDEAAKEKRLAAKVERARKDIANDEIFAKLQDEHPEKIGRVHTPRGDLVVVKAPVGIVYQRLVDEMSRSESTNKHVRTSAAGASEKAAVECVLYPDRAKYKELAAENATLSISVVAMALDLGKTEAVEEEGK